MMRICRARVLWIGLVLLTPLVGCTDPEEEQRSLREALARLPQDTSSPARDAEEPLITDSVVFDTSGSVSLPDSVGFFDEPPVVPIERDTTPSSLTPGSPQDTEPWIPERDSIPLAPEWTADVRESSGEGGGMAVLESVRAARNDGFDRIVFEFESGQVPGYRVEYVDRPVRQCGSGQVVPLRGDGWLRIRLEPSQAHDEEGRPTVEDRARSTDLPVLRQLRLICDYEAQVEWILGVESPNPFRVAELTAPARLVVDVRH